MSFETYWHHHTITADEYGRALIGVSGPAGAAAVSGGGWCGGGSTDTSENPFSVAGFAPIAAQFPEYDAVSDTTSWNIIFDMPPGTSTRAHVFVIVDES